MIVEVKELHQKRRSSIRNGVLTHTRAWIVRSDDPADGTAAAMFAEGIPRYGDPLGSSFGAPVVTGIDADPVQESDTVFHVVVEYTTPDFESSQTHPLDRPPEFSWGANEFTEPYFLDESTPERRAFVTSAGDPFEQSWERNKAELTITMVRNEPIWDVLAADELANTTNAEIVFLDGQPYDVDTLLLGLASAQKLVETWQGVDVEFYRVTRTFKARRDGWLDRPLDFGLNQLVERQIGNETVIQRVPILDAAGLKTRPWPLNGEGVALPNATDTPAELEFRPYRSASWASLGLA